MTTPDLFGAGRVVYAAVNPLAAYRHEGHHLARRALMYLLGLVAPPDRRLVTAWKPLHVEISGYRQGEQLVVHLLNNNQQKTLGRLAHVEEVTPVHNIALDVRPDRPARRVMLEPGSYRSRGSTTRAASASPCRTWICTPPWSSNKRRPDPRLRSANMTPSQPLFADTSPSRLGGS